MAKCILVASGKGGVGKSTFTAGISSALSERGLKILAIDCDIGLRSLDLLLGHSSDIVFDWGDVLLERCEAKQAIINGDVDFIAAPRSFDDGFTDEAFGAMIKELSADYDYIFIDSPAGIDRGFRLAASGADRAVVITTPDCVCVRSCSRAFSELEKLGIKNAKAFHGRAEDFAHEAEYREKFDFAVSRAVANLSTLTEYCLPFVHIDGYFLPYKGANITEELNGAERAVNELGGKVESIVEYSLPGNEGDRTIIKIRKIKTTSDKYPRKAGKPSKSPL